MGVRLIVEVLDFAPANLTPRERWFLIVLAEGARDHTRVCWPGVEDDEIFIRRTRIASRSQRYSALKALIQKGALENVVRGQKGVRAGYRIPKLAPEGAVLPPAQGPESPDAEANAQGPGSPDNEPQRPESPDAENPDVDRSGSRFSDFSVPETRTPSPQSPHVSKEKPKMPPKDSGKPSPNEGREDVERVCAHLRQRIIDNGKPAHRVKITKDWRDAARLLMDRDGVTEDQVHRAIDWVQEHSFWHTNVRSMTKLREKYFELRDQAAQEQRRRQPAPGSMASQRTAAKCSEHTLPLPCSSCIGDIRAGDTEVPRRLLAEHGPTARPDLAEHLNSNGAAA